MHLLLLRHGQQNISLSINPAPTFTQKIPLLGKLASKAMTWKVGKLRVTQGECYPMLQ